MYQVEEELSGPQNIMKRGSNGSEKITHKDLILLPYYLYHLAYEIFLRWSVYLEHILRHDTSVFHMPSEKLFLAFSSWEDVFNRLLFHSANFRTRLNEVFWKHLRYSSGSTALRCHGNTFARHIFQYRETVDDGTVESYFMVFCDADEVHSCHGVATFSKEVTVTVNLVLLHVQDLAPYGPKTRLHAAHG